MALLENYQKHGSKWIRISKELPGRCENTIKNKFHSLKKEGEYFCCQRYGSHPDADVLRRPPPSTKEETWIEAMLCQKRKMLLEEGMTMASKLKQTLNVSEVDIGEDYGAKMAHVVPTSQSSSVSDASMYTIDSQLFQAVE